MAINTNKYVVNHETLSAYAEVFKTKSQIRCLLGVAIDVIAALIEGGYHPTIKDLDNLLYPPTHK